MPPDQRQPIMPRERRRHRRNYNEPGHAHELTFSCFRGYKFLQSKRTCRWLCSSIDAARTVLDFSVWAYVFMPEHAHVIVCPRQPVYDIAVIRQAIKQPVAKSAVNYLWEHAPQWIPRIGVEDGGRVRRCFWQRGGGYDRNITEPATLASMIEYIHLNPVRRGLVERADQWPWSSAACFAGTGDSPLRLDRIPPELCDGG